MPALTPSPVVDHQSKLADHLIRALDARRLADLFRTRRLVRTLDPTHVEVDGRRLINFAGNDYLALSHHPALDPLHFCHRVTVGSGASALVSGYTADHAEAERCIARWKSTESAVLLPSGYQANHAAIQTFAAIAGGGEQGVRFLVDKLAHASLIDAVRATGCSFRVFPHNGIDKLQRLLASAPATQLQVIVTESIFSMDGDPCSLERLVELRERFGCALLVDEAHGSGVYGPGGGGLAAELHLSNSVDVSICTFSKAAGLVGGAVCGSKLFCDALVNFGRAYIYSTAVPSTLARQIAASIDLMSREPERQRILRASAARVRSALSAAGWTIPEGDSPIIPIIFGEESAAIDASARLMEAGVFTIAIRPPTVPRNSSRLRLTLNSAHTVDEIEHLLHSINTIEHDH